MSTMYSAHLSRKRFSLFFAAVFTVLSFGVTPAKAADIRLLDVVEVTWAGAGAPVANANGVARLIDTEVNQDWLTFTTMYGDTTDRSVSFKAGQVLSTPILLSSKMACTGVSASQFMSSIRPDAYKRLGISDYSTRYLVVVAPKAGCVWSGRAQLGGPTSKSGTLILHDTASSFVITHELGHTFGLGHTNFLRCENAAADGAWGSSCKGVEYGGSIDVMGNVDTTSPLSTYHQWRMGYLNDSQVKQVWQSEVVTLSPSDFANGTKAIFVRDGKAAYWIEYRRKLDGVGYKPGLVIYRLDPPPVSAIVSPNPEDGEAAEFAQGIGTDLWMLNLDTYQYKDSRQVSGSMTGLTAKTYSGNVSFSAVASETGAIVSITKKVDTTPPPTPNVVPVDQWRSPNMAILSQSDDDADTAIVGYEGQINGVVQTLKASDLDGWVPTFLSPFFVPQSFYLRDLPEGSYPFAVRAIDLAGNKSEWSATVQAVVDRGDPVVKNDFFLTSANSKQLSVQWRGATDAGSGICLVQVVDEDGLVKASSTVKNRPTFEVQTGDTLAGTAQVFDCLGNGLTGEISISNSYIPADKSSRTGKWSPATAIYGAGAMKCTGKCTASISIKGKFEVVIGSGSATVSVGSKNVASIKENTSRTLNVGASIDVGTTKKVVRVSGSNFVLVGLASVSTSVGTLKELDQKVDVADESLLDPKQVALANFGFRASDFGQEWSVLPMARGTTLADPSLDLCNGSFASEKDRVERRQVIATKPGSTFSFLSTEVVKYRSAAAATAAQKELVKVLAQCQNEKGYTDLFGTYVPYEFKAIKNIPSGVVSEGNRLFVHAVIDSGADARTLLGFYQFNGDTYTGLYVMNSQGFSEAQVAKWLKVAVTMAERLYGNSV